MRTEYIEQCEKLAQELGVETLIKALPDCATIERVKAALAAGDGYLNTIPLGAWDKAVGFDSMRNRIDRYSGAEIFRKTRLSCSERVSLLKHVARVHLLNQPAKPEPKPYIPQPPVDYEKQAQDFLDKFGIKFRATLSDSKPAPWIGTTAPKDRGEPHHYRVTLSKSAGEGRYEEKKWVVLHKQSSRITFDFWGSIADAKKGRTELSAYDVLACISNDAHTPDTFKEFCGEFGYEQDSIKALQTFNRCSRFAKRLQAFFTEQEIAALQEIQ